MRISLTLFFLLLISPHTAICESLTSNDLPNISAQIYELTSDNIYITSITRVNEQIIIEGTATSPQHVNNFLKKIKEKNLGFAFIQKLIPEQIEKRTFHFIICVDQGKPETFVQSSTSATKPASSGASMTSAYVYRPAIEKKYKHLLYNFDFLVEVGVGCIGHLFYAEEGKFTEEELEWLRMLLIYRFNGTKVPHIEFEESAEVTVSDRQIDQYLSKVELRNWLGSDLIEKLQNMKKTRSALVSAANEHKWEQEEFYSNPVYKQYNFSANLFADALSKKFGITSKDNSDDCD